MIKAGRIVRYPYYDSFWSSPETTCAKHLFNYFIEKRLENYTFP